MISARSSIQLALLLTFLCAPLIAQREPVLKQIDLPHPYYFREMYLPQLTSGPSWVAWAPDSKEVVYSMAGSLWQQKINSNEAIQLTDGPGYDYQPDWSRDGKWIVYTKYDHDALELWLLEVATGKTTQLTKDGAVNVEPRFSPDGKHILYVSTAQTKHFHLFLMDIDDGTPLRIRQLTKEFKSVLPRYYYSQFDHEINPTWSPDGKEIVFVSNHGHIHGTGGIWRAKLPESPDGMIDVGKDAREIHYEETTWKARPEFAPDGKRIVYASYLGRQWHQLWLMTADGGNIFPLTYELELDPHQTLATNSPSQLRSYRTENSESRSASSGYDNINARWSPDGSKIAFISNRVSHAATTNPGDIGAWVVDVRTGVQKAINDGAGSIPFRDRHYMRPHIPVVLSLADDSDEPGATARVSVTDDAGRDYISDRTSTHADDSFDPKHQPNEHHYFFDAGAAVLELPAGRYTATAFRGLQYAPQSLHFEITDAQIAQALRSGTPSIEAGVITLKPLQFADNTRWLSGDLHVHMNYAGTYRQTGNGLLGHGIAEGLDVIENLIVNKEQRFPDIVESSAMQPLQRWFQGLPLVVNGQEFHTSYWGHLGLLNIKHLILPGYAAYPNTAAASLVPMNADVADMAHAQNKDALVGYVHPFDELPDPYKDPKLTDELPVDVALGKVDYYEVLGFSDHKASAAIWYRLLNLGFHLPTGAGTDAMTNFASLRGPVGLNRVYVNVSSEPLNLDEWLKNLKAGKTFATNGPLLRFSLGNQPIGGELKLDKPGEVAFTAAMRSIVAVDKVEVVCNGGVVRMIFGPGNDNPRSFTQGSRAGKNVREPSLAQDDSKMDSEGHPAITSFDVRGTIPIQHSGWCTLRAYSDHAEEPIMDIYPYATTSPIYVTVAGEKPHSLEDARFFMKWIDRIEESASQWKEYNSDAEKQHVMDVLHRGRAVFESMAH